MPSLAPSPPCALVRCEACERSEIRADSCVCTRCASAIELPRFHQWCNSHLSGPPPPAGRERSSDEARRIVPKNSFSLGSNDKKKVIGSNSPHTLNTLPAVTLLGWGWRRRRLGTRRARVWRGRRMRRRRLRRTRRPRRRLRAQRG